MLFRSVHFALERALLTAHLECKMHLSRAECTSRRAQDRPAPNIPNGSRPHRPALTPAHGPRLPVKEGSVNWATASRDRIGPCIALTMGTRPGDGVALPPTPRRQLNGVRVLGMKERGGLDSEAPHGASCRRHPPRRPSPSLSLIPHTSGGPNALYGPGALFACRRTDNCRRSVPGRLLRADARSQRRGRLGDEHLRGSITKIGRASCRERV